MSNFFKKRGSKVYIFKKSGPFSRRRLEIQFLILVAQKCESTEYTGELSDFIVRMICRGNIITLISNVFKLLFCMSLTKCILNDGTHSVGCDKVSNVLQRNPTVGLMLVRGQFDDCLVFNQDTKVDL